MITLLYIIQNFKAIIYSSSWEQKISDVILLEATYNRNLGDFGQIYNKASGFYLSYGKFFEKSYHVILRTGYTGYSVKDNSMKDSVTFSAIPIQIGGRYYVLSDRIMPYFSFMNGINLISQDKNIAGATDKQTLVRYTWQAGFGLVFKIVPLLNFDINARYNNNFYHPDAMMTSLEYGAGFSYNLK